jgi:hypothetical protein
MKEEILKAKQKVLESKAKIKKDNAQMLVASKTGLNKMETVLKKMLGSEALVERAKELITETDTLAQKNANDEDINDTFTTLQDNIKQLALDAQALIKLNKANAAAKK